MTQFSNIKNGDNKKFLLDLARKAIENFLETGKELDVDNVPEEIKKERACFVTLTKNGRLRGCIGNIEAFEPLYLDLIKNAIAAAFYDPRFEPVIKDELKDIEIEISVLGEIRKIGQIGQIREGQDGVIMEKDGRRAVFLPQVWEELPTKEDFLKHLALKAGLSENDWKTADYEVFDVEILK
jgi:AmmeMemoRadiSam system protein A